MSEPLTVADLDALLQARDTRVHRIVHDAIHESLGNGLGEAVRDIVEEQVEPLADEVAAMRRTIFGPDSPAEAALSPGAIAVISQVRDSLQHITRQMELQANARHVNRRWITTLATLSGLGGGAMTVLGQGVVRWLAG